MHLKSTTRQTAFALAALFLLLIVVYANSFQGQWQYDDFVNIVRNPNVHMTHPGLDDLGRAVHGKNLGQGISRRPLSYLTFALNYYFSGLDVFGWHLVNFSVHYMSTAALFLLLLNIFGLPVFHFNTPNAAYSAALLSAAFWATHPIQVTAVTYLVQRMAALSGMFYLIAMLCYFKGRTGQKRGYRTAAYGACVISGICACASKENAAMLPFSLLLLDLILIRKGRPGNRRPYIIAAALLLVLVLLAGLYGVTPNHLLRQYEGRNFTLIERVLTEPRILLFYISLLAYPTSGRFALLHDPPVSTDLFTPWTTLPAMLAVAGLILLAVRYRQRHPFAAFCILFFFLNHVVEGSIIPLELIYEHRNYLPSSIPSGLLGLGILRLMAYFAGNKKIKGMIVLVTVCLLVSQAHTTIMRNRLFQVEELLWRDNLEKAPNLSVVHSNLGKCLWNRKAPHAAKAAFEKALALDRFHNRPQYGITHLNLGLFYAYEMHDAQQAMRHLKKAARYRVGFPTLFHELGRAAAIIGNPDEAESYFRQGLGHWPDDTQLLTGLGLLLLKKGETRQALPVLRKALRTAPHSARVLAVLGQVMRALGDLDKAIFYWKRVAEIDTGDPLCRLALIELNALANRTADRDKWVYRFLCRIDGEPVDVAIRNYISRHSDAFTIYTPDITILMEAVKQTMSSLGQTWDLSAPRH